MNKQHWWKIAAAVGCCAAASRWAVMPAAALARDTGAISVSPETQESPLRKVPVMISIVRDGAIVAQKEAPFGYHPDFRDLTPGTYDVRVEGDGMVTLMKRGVQVIGGKTTGLITPMKAGTGAHVVEFAVGGLPREEVAARLMQLEAAVADLKKRAPK